MTVETKTAGQWMYLRASTRPGYAVYECTCGTVKEVLMNNVNRGLSKSCGCYKTDVLRARNKRVVSLSAELSALELSWAAGFWDGEGCTTGSLDRRAAIRNPRQRIQMQVSQSEEAGLQVLQRFQRAVGGLGHVLGPYTTKLGHKPVYRWNTQGFETVQAIIAMLWPYLSEPKRAQAVLRLTQMRGGG